MLDHNAIMNVLRTIPDPEMPISIVDLGLVEDVRIDDSACDSPSPMPSPRGRGCSVSIDLLPTFIGCPALDMIAGDVRAKIGALAGVGQVKVNWVFDPAWTVDRITEAGRESLKAHGVTVPEPGSNDRLHIPARDMPQMIAIRTSAVPCPYCGSRATYLDSAFGPTRCRTIHYCESCKNSFEHLKRV